MLKTENSSIREDRFFTLSEAQSYLGIRSRKTILKYVSSGELSAYKVGGTRWRISRRDIDSFLETCKMGCASESRGAFSNGKKE